MAEQTPKPLERQPQHEAEPSPAERNTLYARLLYAPAINPEANTLRPPTAGELAQPDGSYLADCLSNACGAACEAGTPEYTAENTYEQVLTEWKQDLVEKMTEQCDPNTDEGQRSRVAFSRLGIRVDGFGMDGAQDIYDRFCFQGDQRNKMDQFTKLVAEKFTVQEIHTYAEEIQWLAHIGGEGQEPEAVLHTAIAEKMRMDQQECERLAAHSQTETMVDGQMVSTFNLLSPEDEQVLRLLWDHRPGDIQQIPTDQQPPAEPPLHPEPAQSPEPGSGNDKSPDDQPDSEDPSPQDFDTDDEQNEDETEPVVYLPPEDALLYAMYHKDSMITVTGQGEEGRHWDTANWQQLVQEYKNDPKDKIGLARQAIIHIHLDTNLDEIHKSERIKDHVDALLKLIIQLDAEAFPDDTTVSSGIPDYIPDGFIDMGADDEINPDRRGREQIRVEKQALFDQSQDLLYTLFTNPDLAKLDSASDNVKKWMIENIANYIYREMPYDHAQNGPETGDIVPLHDIRTNKNTVCRHHALYGQIMFQIMGLTSRLLKTNVDFGRGKSEAHANNLVRVNKKWRLIDITNPEADERQQTKDGTPYGRFFVRPIPEENIDLNTNTYEWEFNDVKTWNPTKRKIEQKTYSYQSRNNMYHRIEKGAQQTHKAA
jgi:hypothetical protein